jgi:hypothetical protein
MVAFRRLLAELFLHGRSRTAGHLCESFSILRWLLPDVLREHPELVATGRLTLLQSLRCVRLVLWDEDGRRLISFRDMGRRYIRDCKVG